jgi:RimJ/RimL family protein N-acetyltransferase
LVSATTDDCLLTYSWASNPEIRKYSFNQEPIPFESHQKWFSEKCTSNECFYYILKRGQNAIGSIRIDLNEHQQVGLISYLIDPSEQKKGYGLTIIELLETKLLDTFRSIKLRAFVTTENTASIKIFEKAGYSKLLNEEKWVFEKIITS